MITGIMSWGHRAAAGTLFVCVLTIAWTRTGSTAPVSYTLVIDELRDLGTLPGHTWSEAHAINENGAIAGSSETSTGLRRAVFWPPSPTAAPVNLTHLGGGWSEAWGINDNGVVVGNSKAAGSTAVRGFRWTQPGGMIDLNLTGFTLGTGPIEWYTAKDINNSGLIVGDFYNGAVIGPAGYLLGWGVWIAPPCPPPPDLLLSHANAINDQGFFTGNVMCEGGPSLVAYFASLTTMAYFPTPSGETADQGYAINEQSRVAGARYTKLPNNSGQRLHAFRWSASTGFLDIHPGNDTSSESIARGINGHNLIVGRKYGGNSSAAFAYGQGIQMRTLPGLCTFGSATSASEAFAVNDAGWIVGSSKTCSGQTHATLWKVRVLPVVL